MAGLFSQVFLSLDRLLVLRLPGCLIIANLLLLAALIALIITQKIGFRRVCSNHESKGD